MDQTVHFSKGVSSPEDQGYRDAVSGIGPQDTDSREYTRGYDRGLQSKATHKSSKNAQPAACFL